MASQPLTSVAGHPFGSRMRVCIKFCSVSQRFRGWVEPVPPAQLLSLSVRCGWNTHSALMGGRCDIDPPRHMLTLGCWLTCCGWACDWGMPVRDRPSCA